MASSIYESIESPVNKFFRNAVYLFLLFTVLIVGITSYGVDHVLNNYVVERAKVDSLNLGRWLYFSLRNNFVVIESDGGRTLGLQDDLKDASEAVNLHLSTQFSFFPIQSIVLYNTSGIPLHQTAISEVKASGLSSEIIGSILDGAVSFVPVFSTTKRVKSVTPDNLRTRFAVYDSNKLPLGIFEIEVDLYSYRDNIAKTVVKVTQFIALTIIAVAGIVFSLLIFWRKSLPVDVPVQVLPKVLVVCSICNRFQDEDGRWVAVEGEAGYIDRAVSHTVCPGCLEDKY